MKAQHRISRRVALTWLVVAGATSWQPTYAGDHPQPGDRYIIVGNIYAIVVYRDLNDRRLNRQLSWVSLVPFRISGPEVALTRTVPLGAVLTVLGPAPKRAPLPFLANRYFVRLESVDLPAELDVILQLNRGIEGNLDGLNPALFARYQSDGTLSLPTVPSTIGPRPSTIEAPVPGAGEGN